MGRDSTIQMSLHYDHQSNIPNRHKPRRNQNTMHRKTIPQLHCGFKLTYYHSMYQVRPVAYCECSRMQWCCTNIARLVARWIQIDSVVANENFWEWRLQAIRGFRSETAYDNCE